MTVNTIIARKNPVARVVSQLSSKRFQSQTLRHYWRRIKGTSPSEAASASLSILRQGRSLLPFLLARSGSRLNTYLRARPEILEMVHGPYLAANWDAPTKVGRVINHLQAVAEIGGIVDQPPDRVIDLIDPKSIAFDYRITLDQARWLLREGQLVLSLWDGKDRIFSLSFSLSTQGGRRAAYIGGIQGRRQVAGEPDILDRYRVFTKAAFGSRPRDFLVEVFRMFCKAIGVTEIFAVADVNHPTRGKNLVGLSYDEIWLERGGIDNNDGFYSLPVSPERRNEEKIPAKKRALYRKRFALLASIEKELEENLRRRSQLQSKPIVCEVRPPHCEPEPTSAHRQREKLHHRSGGRRPDRVGQMEVVL